MLNLGSMSYFSPLREQGGGDHGGEHITPTYHPAIAVAGLVGFGVVAAFKAAVRVPALQFSRRGCGDGAD
jgi:hypothetical protein